MLKIGKIKSRTKKVIFVVTLAELGGAQKYIRDLSEGLRSKYDITIAANTENEALFSWAKNNNFTAVPLTNLNQKLFLGLFPTPGDFKTFWELYTLFKNFSYDIVHLNSSKIGFIGAAAAKLAGVRKIIFTAHGWVFNEPSTISRSKNKKWAWVLISKLAAYAQNKIICVSNYDFDQAIKYSVAPPRKMATIYNGLDPKKVRFQEREKARAWIVKKTGIELPKVVLGTIANYYGTKDLLTMVRSLKHLPTSMVLVIIGEGPERKNLEDSIKNLELEDRVFLLGRVPNAAQYLRAFDAYIISSQKEGLPFSALEVMAAKLPIVSAPSGGLKNLFFSDEKKPGALSFTPGNATELAQQIKTLIKNKDLQKVLINNAEQILKSRFTLEEMVKKTRWVWES